MDKNSEQTDFGITPAIYTSFVLRCHVNGSGEVRAYLVDVRTGTTHPLKALEMVPEIVRGLLDPLMGCRDEKGG